MHTVAVGSIVLFALASVAPAQKITWAVVGDRAGDWLGGAVADAGDVNNDGTPDLIVGATEGHQVGAGYARVYCGKTGKVLRTFRGSGTEAFGFVVAGGADVNNDGRPDLIVGAPFARTHVKKGGRAVVFSGKDGKVLRTIVGGSANDELGRGVALLRDVNGDGYGEILVGASQEFGGSGKGGYVLWAVKFLDLQS